MAAPVSGAQSDPYDCSDDSSSSSSSSEDDSSSPTSLEHNIPIAPYTKTSNTPPTDPDAPSSSKRKKSKPTRFDVYGADVQKEHRRPKIKIVVRKNPSSGKCLSMRKTKSPAKPLLPPSPTMIRAEEFQASLGTEFPSCVKQMLKTQVSYGFWMGLPIPFCRSFMPKQDAQMVLEDENGGQWEVKYIAHRSVLSSGWKIFVIAHDLVPGDVLVFHIIETFKLKIYILRERDSDAVGGALGLLNLEAHAQQEPTPITPLRKLKKRKNPEPLLPTIFKKKHKKKPTPPTPKSPIEVTELLELSGSEEVGSEVLEPSTTLPHTLKSFENFRIIVNGQCLDSELPQEVKLGYYKLCLHKKEILHESIREGLYYKLVAGMVGETVNIAKEIKNCKLTISKEELEAWDNSLKSFEILGMKVGFLREKVGTILRLVFESEFGVDVKRYVEAKKEEKVIEDEIKRVKGKLLELKIKARNFEGVLGELKEKAEKYMIDFRDEVDVPW